MNALALYGRYISISVRSQLVYRASFIMQTVGIFAVTAAEFLAIWALFARFGSISGWTLPEVAFFYGLVNVTFSIADAMARGFELFGTQVQQGDFDRLLLRPRSTVLQLFGQEVTLRRIGRLAQGLGVLAFAIGSLNIEWSAARIALLILTIPCGVSVFAGLVILRAASAFWTTESLEVWNAFTYGGVTMGQYPLAIYRPWFRRFFLFVIPLGCISYLPGVAILGRPDPLGTPASVQWLAPLAGPAFLWVCLQVWKAGVRHYQSTGS